MERTTTNSLVPFQSFQPGRMKLRHTLFFFLVRQEGGLVHPPCRAAPPQISEVRRPSCTPAGFLSVPAVKGLHSANERSPPAGSFPVPSVATVTPQRSEVRQRAVLCLFTLNPPLGIRGPYNTAHPVSTFMCRRCFSNPPSSPVVSVPSFVLACTGLPPRLISRVTLGDYHRRRSWCS